MGKLLTRIAFRFRVRALIFAFVQQLQKKRLGYVLCFFVASLSQCQFKSLNVYLTNGWYTFPAGSSSSSSNSIGPVPPEAGIIRGGSCSVADCYDARTDVAPTPVASQSTAYRNSRCTDLPLPVH